MRIVFLAAFALLHVSSASAAEFSGRASVIDGDTIDIAGQRIRFNGIDAPESRQSCEDSSGSPYRCGKDAAFALDQFLAASRPTRCEQVGKDRYKRIVANCFRADGQNVSTWMVRNGHALDWPRYSKGAYATVQNAAKDEHIGVWQGRFDPPWEWRKRR